MALSVNGLTATFGGNGAVCASAGLAGGMFVSLSGNALMQGFCNPVTAGPLSISFSDSLSRLRFALAINGTTPVPVTVTFLRGGTAVATQTVQPVVPAGALSPEAVVSYSGTFDAVTLTSVGLLAIDNLDAVPTPTTPTTPTGGH